MHTAKSLVAFTFALAAACGGTTSSEQGDTMEGKDYQGAISVLADKTAAEPDNAKAWHLYGYALHAAGRLDEALSVHQKAATFDETRPVALYNVACVHALKGDAGAAFAALDQAVAAGFSGVEHLESDSDLASIRSDRRFSAVVEAARANPAPKKRSQHGH